MAPGRGPVGPIIEWNVVERSKAVQTAGAEARNSPLEGAQPTVVGGDDSGPTAVSLSIGGAIQWRNA